MAIRQDTIIAIRKNYAQKVLRIANVNDKYTECTYPIDPNQAIDLKNHKWGHYFICGYKGFYEFAKSKGVDMGDAVGLDVIVDGTVPTGSGLSSSAAFVCSATIAIMAAFDVNFPKCTFLVPLSYLRRGSISVVIVWCILCVFHDDIRCRNPNMCRSRTAWRGNVLPPRFKTCN